MQKKSRIEIKSNTLISGEEVLQGRVLEVDTEQAIILIASNKATKTNKKITSDIPEQVDIKALFKKLEKVNKVEELEVYLDHEDKNVIKFVKKKIDKIKSKS